MPATGAQNSTNSTNSTNSSVAGVTGIEPSANFSTPSGVLTNSTNSSVAGVPGIEPSANFSTPNAIGRGEITNGVLTIDGLGDVKVLYTQSFPLPSAKVLMEEGLSFAISEDLYPGFGGVGSVPAVFPNITIKSHTHSCLHTSSMPALDLFDLHENTRSSVFDHPGPTQF